MGVGMSFYVYKGRVVESCAGMRRILVYGRGCCTVEWRDVLLVELFFGSIIVGNDLLVGRLDRVIYI